MDRHIKKHQVLENRHRRVRRRLSGNSERPRLSVSKSLKNIEAQLIDDIAGRSILGLSSRSKEFQARGSGGKIEMSRAVGRLLAEKALQSGYKKVVFDRGGHLYHGRIKALAEGAREGGLEF